MNLRHGYKLSQLRVECSLGSQWSHKKCVQGSLRSCLAGPGFATFDKGLLFVMYEYRKRPIWYYLLVVNAVVAFQVVCFFLTSPTELSYSSEFSLSHFVETKQLCKLTFLAAFKFGRRVHCALRRKIQKSPITRVPAIIRKWKVEQHLR